MTQTRALLIGVVGLLVGACSAGSNPSTAPPQPPAPDEQAVLIALPPVDPAAVEPTTVEPATDRVERQVTAALIDTAGHLATVRDGTISDEWFKWTAFPSPDRSTAVLTLPRDITGIGPTRPVQWVSLPDGAALAEQTVSSDLELTATSLDGAFAGFTSQAAAIVDGAIAGGRRTSTIEIVSRDGGSVFEQQLTGNFMPEAFSRSTSSGVPSHVFLLEYFPAESPRFYRVRVLSTVTGEVSLPLNLRNKTEQVDERMAGFSRSQVVAHEHGLLFTLYRGTIDGTPDGEPYAFVHTLDFADGVWCLEVDPTLQLDTLPGSLAVGGDRLYVASANGRVGSFRIPSITDPNLSPSMDWVVEATGSSNRAPVMVADGKGALVSQGIGRAGLIHVTPTGEVDEHEVLVGPDPTALTLVGGDVVAVGADWSTFVLRSRPEWLGEIAHLITG